MVCDDIDVAVVGGGPVGLVAASFLADAGITVRVFEKDENAPRQEWRGSTLHPPTLAILDRIGFASEAISKGIHVDRIQYRDLEGNAERVAEYRYDYLKDYCEFPFRIQYEQYKLLSALRQAASRREIIEFGATVVSMTDGPSEATLGVAHQDGVTRDYRARWVIGADGAHSVVRKAMGVAFPGSTYPTLSLVVAADLPLDYAWHDVAAVSYCWSSKGRVSLIHTPDVWRLALGTDESVMRSDLVDTPTFPDPEQAHSSYRNAMQLIFPDRQAWVDVPLRQHQFYRSHQRVAETFAQGHVLLIGDAAHLNATQGGMGLNSGIHDAWQAASAVAAALRDRAASGDHIRLFAEKRRSAAVKFVQPTTTANRGLVDLTDEASRRAAFAQELTASSSAPTARQKLLRMSMFDSAPEPFGPKQ